MQKKRDFARRRPGIIGEDRLAKYAVLVPLVRAEGGTAILFERRAAGLRRQPGEICLPGGRLEPGESPRACALRETAEELHVPRSRIGILGPGDVFMSPFDIVIHTYIGVIRDYRGTYNPAEVAEVLTVPLAFFRETAPEEYAGALIHRPSEDFPYERIPGGESYPWATGTHRELFYGYGGQVIWGITALLVQSAADLIFRHGLEEAAE